MTKTRKNKIYHKKTRKHRVFNKKHFNSADGFLTAIWGPAQWHILHTISFNYPNNPTKEQKLQYKNYILSLQHVLPCSACRKNLKMNFKHLPLTMNNLKSRDTFSRYIYNLHELVNKMLNKTSNLSYCDVRERYEHFRARCVYENPKVFKYSDIIKNKTEKGCTEPLYGQKSRCILNIVPQKNKGQSIQINKACIKKCVEKNNN